jgi:hypothetical protein
MTGADQSRILVIADFFGSGVATWTTETVEIYLCNDRWQIDEPSPGYGLRQSGQDSSSRYQSTKRAAYVSCSE